uniref:Uncharacterized protein n=1 Tax=Lactuca sativa TaxID=4236 RepID=A0A9R1XIM3_LACSA|nr:hypothetical protein LSAT_V11C400225450 [Lactuca sativa]
MEEVYLFSAIEFDIILCYSALLCSTGFFKFFSLPAILLLDISYDLLNFSCNSPSLLHHFTILHQLTDSNFLGQKESPGVLFSNVIIFDQSLIMPKGKAKPDITLHFEENFNADKEVKCGLYDVIERMYDRSTMVTIHEQLVKFNESIGMFGISTAVLIRKKMQPAKWWSSYGDECPKLQHLEPFGTSTLIHDFKRENKEGRLMIQYVCRTWSRMMNGLLKRRMYVSLKISHGWMFMNDEGTRPRNLNKVTNVKDKAKSQLVDLDDEDEDEGDDIGFHETTVVEDEDDDDHFYP